MSGKKPNQALECPARYFGWIASHDRSTFVNLANITSVEVSFDDDWTVIARAECGVFDLAKFETQEEALTYLRGMFEEDCSCDRE